MRIISGEYGSRKIDAPAGTGTRPTPDRVREALFSMLIPWLEGARTLDLFAGSGALSLEAVSRGANFALMCEADRGAFATIQKNINSLHANERARVERTDAFVLARTLAVSEERFDIIFLDPPYNAGLTDKALSASAALLSPNGVIVSETGSGVEPAPPPGFLRRLSRKYGDCRISLFTRAEA